MGYIEDLVTQRHDYLSSLTPQQLADLYSSYDTQYDPSSGSKSDFFRRQNQVATKPDEDNFNAYRSFKSIVGRNPTASEFAEILPIFQGSNGQQLGNAYLAQFAESEKQRPENLRKRSGEYSGQVGNIYQDLLNRGASQAEIEHFGSLLASGQVDEYTLRQFVQQLPEYQSAQDKSFREGLNTELQGYDTDAFNKGKEDILSSYARSGKSNSSALDFALTNLMGDIAKERGRYLSGLSAQQYGGNKAAARQDYGAALDDYISSRDYGRDLRQNRMSDYITRGRELSDYDRQMEDYMRMANKKRNSALNTRDWVNIGLGVTNAAANAYGGFN